MTNATPLSEALAWGRPDRPLLAPFGSDSVLCARAVARFLTRLWQDVSTATGAGARLDVVEVGATSARLAVRVLAALTDLGDPIPLRWVLASTDPSRVEAWAGHPRLAPLLAEGRLGLATSAAQGAGEIVLRSGERVGGPSSPSPLVLVARGFFGALRADAFVVRSAVAWEILAARQDGENGPSLRFEERPVDAVDRWGRPPGMKVWLADALAAREGEVCTVPVQADEALSRWQALAGGPLVVLAFEGSVGDRRRLELADQDGVLLPVDPDPLAALVFSRGGWMCSGGGPWGGLRTLVMMLGGPFSRAQSAAVEQLGEVDLGRRLALLDEVATHSDEAEVWLAVLDETGWDPDWLPLLAERLLAALPTLTDAPRSRLAAGIQRAGALVVLEGPRDDGLEALFALQAALVAAS